ncbi:MAG: ATP-dependent DNA helicase [Candidatus Sericytochromatia bacterium]
MAYDAAWLQTHFDETLPAAGFDVREEQLAMANYVHTALTRHRHLLAEAGVGTGKTFAYLLPAYARLMRTKMPVVIATHTIALQEQLIHKDLPALRDLLGEPVQALLAKGKEHYLCPAKELALKERTPEPTPDQARLSTWARRTRTGDRTEIADIPDSLWAQVNLDDRQRCAGCRYEFTCPTAGTRRKWQNAWGFIVTNHHQFFADLSLRASGRGLFAAPGAVILDEAHALADTAREMLGHRTSLGGLRGAIEGSRFQLRREDASWKPVAAWAEAFERLIAARVQWRASDEAERFELATDAELLKAATQVSAGMRRLVDALGAMPQSPNRTNAAQRLADAHGALFGLLRPDRYLTWVEGNRAKRRVSAVVAVPRDLSGVLRQRLFEGPAPVVLTSATLSVAEDFSYMKAELGLDNPLACSVGSPFDFERQARLYIAEDLADPNRDPDAFYLAAIERLKAMLATLDGRTLVLFTAKSRSKQAFQALQAWNEVPVMLQDRANPHQIATFQASERAVLLGTAYWEGLDVPGLSAVVIVKLPFPVEDPLEAAKMATARAAGLDPFDSVLLPEMLLRLKQGAGRLIRRTTDRGVIAILDPRAATRERYAETIRDSLPPVPRVESWEEAAAFVAGARQA